jgi:hypothetical protein
MTTKPTKRVRCAVYTRVSTEYGLDQEFNSLDAQGIHRLSPSLNRRRCPSRGRADAPFVKPGRDGPQAASAARL